jgi:hypothetical protein
MTGGPSAHHPGALSWFMSTEGDLSWDYTPEQKQAIIDAIQLPDGGDPDALLAEVADEARRFRGYDDNDLSHPGRPAVKAQLEAIDAGCETLHVLARLHQPTYQALGRSAGTSWKLIQRLRTDLTTLESLVGCALKNYETRGSRGRPEAHWFAGRLKDIYDRYAPGPGVTYVPEGIGGRGRDDDALTGRFIDFGRAAMGPARVYQPDSYLREAWKVCEAAKKPTD